MFTFYKYTAPTELTSLTELIVSLLIVRFNATFQIQLTRKKYFILSMEVKKKTMKILEAATGGISLRFNFSLAKKNGIS